MPKISFDDLAWPLTVGDLHAEAVRVALLQNQYLPHVKSEGEELPPIFTSATFSVDSAKELAALGGADQQAAAWVELRARRFDGLVRRLGVPHPVPYSRLVLHLADHWSELVPLLDSEQSQIKPAFHSDGRMIQMDYETSEDALSRDARLAHGNQFLVKSDVSNCFPSIYSHSIDWAARGKFVAKKDRSTRAWQAKLDLFVRNCHDSETKGVMIGPAVSNLLAELVLQRVDEILTKKGYGFVRYIDDYTAYCAERAYAEQFVIDLQRALGEYRLDLNTRKTRIVDLREGVGEPWMAEVLAYLPGKWTPLSAARYFRHCELLARRFPLNSVLKFGVKVLAGRRKADEAETSMLVIDELVRLCAFHPHLVPFLADELHAFGKNISPLDAERLGKVLERQMLQASARAETDVVLWLLYVLRSILKRQVLKASWAKILEMDDDMVAVALAVLCPRSKQAVVNRVKDWSYLCAADYEQHWLVRYELRRAGLLTDSDLSAPEKRWMKILLKHRVFFSAL